MPGCYAQCSREHARVTRVTALGNRAGVNEYRYLGPSSTSGTAEELMISARLALTKPLGEGRQFIATMGAEQHLILDDATGHTGPKPIELVAAGLAGCTAFDVITILRQKYHQKVTGYRVSVEADPAERPPQIFTDVRIHHVVTGFEVDPEALETAIRLSEEKYCSVGALVKQTAKLHTTYEVVEEKTEWLARQLVPDAT